ncbi:MAG: TM1266 family iron-only hydrogenase system putative regulator [Eubacterium aggregans]|jgi:putative iron-only hydrogenase system regulator|uniref:Putative iron-only hydrogenase system regulator n=1 Tax=Eubacterium aggregans TaxID=81409 RepID=A0A1H4DQX7_9FIRM|nr:TM1266 family iron-only hydrogenase system putative regulator [Eubacterium aggregans]MDD4692287.1 iron-only hydrogenase system regulator [Eubacterium aggregans]MEA5074708.1 TM1266 family iron-only hydrogenase system putative regulator [Eubacterium aggregans]SEA74928.1 putative iron-only hydrogenase system regulator [Eubacterium aggregans]
METQNPNRIAHIGIIVEDSGAVERLNATLHQYAPYIIGRMGIPCPTHGVSVISVILDAPADIISALSGKLGMLKGVGAKTLYAKVSQ